MFFYLSEHPDICPASTKEPRFFLDLSYPVKSTYRCERDGPDRYEEFYKHCEPGMLRLEATPDYLHSPGTAGRVARCLEDVRVVFLLREPVSRLCSWYRFAREDGRIAGDCSFPEYVRRQEAIGEAPDAPQHLSALRQGRYAEALRPWIEHLGRDRVHVVFFEDLSRDPARTVEGICAFAGLDPSRMPPLEYRVHNPTRGARFPSLHAAYKRFRYAVRQFSHDKPRLHLWLRRLRRLGEPLYWRLNAAGSRVEAELPPPVEERLVGYYAPSVRELAELDGVRLPEAWREVYGG